MPDRYLTAQACLNGHTITRDLESEGGSKYCKKCGSETISACPDCGAQLHGRIYGVPIIAGNIDPDSFCYNCGEPYPWTHSAIAVAQELAAEAEEFDDKEREIIIDAIPDLVTDTQKSKIAITRFKRIVGKYGPKLWGEFKDILIEYASRTTKKMFQEGP